MMSVNRDLILRNLHDGFAGHVDLRPKRPDIQKLLVPLFHEDGDMIDIFLETKDDKTIRISDHGLSLMRLSYDYDINTTNKEKVFRQILNESKISEDQGNLYIDANLENLYPAIMHFGQVVSRICSMRLYKREVIANLFYEMVDEFVVGHLARLNPHHNYLPIPTRDELVVDYTFANDNAKPVHLFMAKENDIAKVRLVAVACLEFLKQGLTFRSAIVHQNFDTLSKIDRKIITNAVDKQFTSIEDFQQHGEQTIARLAA